MIYLTGYPKRKHCSGFKAKQDFSEHCISWKPLYIFVSLQGKLLYCIAPPGQDETEFQQIGYKLQNLADVESKEREAREKAHKQVVFLCFSLFLFGAKLQALGFIIHCSFISKITSRQT